MSPKLPKYSQSQSKQTTLKHKMVLRGVGLHAGKTVRCVLHPAPADHGIVFVRSDLSSQAKIRADVARVVRTDMSTTLGSHGAIVATVEHLMAALRGMGIDNLLVEIDAPEIPIMDGSSRVFAEAVAEAGIRYLDAGKKVVRLRKRVSVRAGDKYVIATPDHKLSIKGSISFSHRVIGEQIFRYSEEKSFLDELASARTFGFLREVEFLHKKGLALGGSLENAIVLDEERVLNPEGLRFKNEFVRHKVLDALGDFALIGHALQAEIEIHKSGHELHAAFIKKVLEDPSNYEVIEFVESGDDILISEIDQPLLAHAY